MRSINVQGDVNGESSRGKGAGRGIRARRFVPYSCRARRPRGVRISSYHSPSDADQSGSDDSTQPPSQPWEPPCPIPQPPPETNREFSPVRESGPNGECIDAAAPTVPTATQEQPKRRHGPDKCTEFEKLRKHGKVLLKINDGETAPCCQNASMFTARVTQIVKQHCDMSYARWTDVPQAQKDELIERVLGDFVLDWDLANHRLTILKQLHKRFNAIHHELHKKYLSYPNHAEALAAGNSMVDPIVWDKLCARWGSEDFKKISRQNKENRKKLLSYHTTGRKSFVRVLEEKKEMVGKLDDLEPEWRTNEAAASVFREVLGHRPGYAWGLGEMVIPESTRQRDREREKEYLALIEKQKKDVDQYKKDAEQYKEDAEQYRKDADSYKTQLDAMNNDMRVLRERQNEYDKMLREFFQHMPSYTESLQSRGETQ